jgi:TolB-like protein/rhodanese-related sulfurtransferase/Flp pilus assembly protein TadD
MSLFAELKRRNVFRVGGAYLALGWVVTQVTATVAPALGMPDWTLKLVIWIGIVGLPLVVAFAWAYELMPEGVRRESELPATSVQPHRTARRLDYITIGMVVAALLLLGVHRILAPGRGSGAMDAAATARSIAVLPFDSFNADPAQTYFADGITADLITDLAHLPGLLVIARNSSFSYKGKVVRPQQIAQELGVRYLLQGSVQRQGDRLRINAQLVDALGGQHLWADRYDGGAGDVFALQDKVIGEIVSALKLELSDDQNTGAKRGETTNPVAYDALLQGLQHLHEGSEAGTNAAIADFERAIALDPDYGRAHAGLAGAYDAIAQTLWGAAAGEGFDRAYEGMKRHLALAMRNPTPLARALEAKLLLREGRTQEALEAIDAAVALAPGDADVQVRRAEILNALGRAPEAETVVRRAMRANPQFSPGYQRTLARAQFHQEKYEDALNTITGVVNMPTDNVSDYATLVACLGQLGRSIGVREAIASYNALAVSTGFDAITVQEAAWWWYGDMFEYDDSYRARLQQGLRKAGVPEGAGTDLPLAEYKRLITRHAGEFAVAGVTEIDLATAQSMIEAGALLVDLRPTADFERGHIPGTVSLSAPELLSRESLGAFAQSDDPVIFSCMGKYCAYSAYGAAKARLWGYSRVYRFAGGYPAWLAAGYPVGTGPASAAARIAAD